MEIILKYRKKCLLQEIVTCIFFLQQTVKLLLNSFSITARIRDNLSRKIKYTLPCNLVR